MAYTNRAIAPTIIERASEAAYNFPSVQIVRPSVARATDGAAANRPAKVLGFMTSPMIANSETISPPMMKRKIRSMTGNHGSNCTIRRTLIVYFGCAALSAETDRSRTEMQAGVKRFPERNRPDQIQEVQSRPTRRALLRSATDPKQTRSDAERGLQASQIFEVLRVGGGLAISLNAIRIFPLPTLAMSIGE